jgi:hypothetical protein
MGYVVSRLDDVNGVRRNSTIIGTGFDVRNEPLPRDHPSNWEFGERLLNCKNPPLAGFSATTKG